MYYVVERLLGRDRMPAADFILYWANSSRVIIRNRKYMLNVITMVIQICDSEMNDVHGFSHDLYAQFLKMKHNFLESTRGVMFLD